MPSLETNVRYIKGVGEARAKALSKLGVSTLRDLISYFPRDYEDRRQVYPLAQLPTGEPACCTAMVASPPRKAYIRKGLDITRVRVVDDGAVMDVSFFNQGYVKDALIVGQTYVFFGIAEGAAPRLTMTNPVFEPLGRSGQTTGCIVPVYPLTAGVTNNALIRAIAQGLDACGDMQEDILPDRLRQKYGLCHARFAYEHIHRPKDFEDLELARRRLVFEEFFVFSAGLALLKSRRAGERGLTLPAAHMEDLYRALPFSLTGAQERAINDALGDMTGGRPMNRLIQGDVGSGKTVVAAACAYLAIRGGYQTAFMAPTEILADQHCASLSALLEPLGIHVELLTGSMRAAQKRKALERIALGQADLVIGTHALISESVEFYSLGLVIADEQHRFGVAQRAALSAKGSGGVCPHVLVMSATPIPRTLALILYGDLDVSVIDELPPGRQVIESFLVSEDKRSRLNGFIRKQVELGGQVYVVCPMVEEDSELNLKSVEEWWRLLSQETFSDLRVGLVHGKLKSAEKQRVMAAFSAGELDILVATTVIEVGVDVPNATLMVIENAERFGLSQLHQLRGRVGRGERQSYCVLVSDTKSPDTRKRLKALVSTTDGFKIAQEDLDLRGPGDFFGARQHGLPQFRVAKLSTDLKTLEEAKAAAADFLEMRGEFTGGRSTALMARIRDLFKEDGDIFN